jgi:hypothetical protein
MALNTTTLTLAKALAAISSASTRLFNLKQYVVNSQAVLGLVLSYRILPVLNVRNNNPV